MIENIIAILVIAAIASGAAFYIYKQKKHGAHCIGCPYSKECGKSSCGCSDRNKTK